MSLASELIQQFEADLEELTLIPSDGGTFEVVVDGTLLYSKLATGRHVQEGEIAGLVAAYRDG